MSKKLLKNIEWGILICSLILLAIGFVALFSATKDAGFDEFRKQAIWTFISIPIMIIVIFIDYNTIAKMSPVLYGLALIALVTVLFTEPIHGARSWFRITETNTVQPSEFAKVILIIFLAYVITKLQKDEKTEINKLWKLAVVRTDCWSPYCANCYTTRLWYSYGICCRYSFYAFCIRYR